MGHARRRVRPLGHREALAPSAGGDPAADMSGDRPCAKEKHGALLAAVLLLVQSNSRPVAGLGVAVTRKRERSLARCVSKPRGKVAPSYYVYRAFGLARAVPTWRYSLAALHVVSPVHDRPVAATGAAVDAVLPRFLAS